jgi:hypothetical protein
MTPKEKFVKKLKLGIKKLKSQKAQNRFEDLIIDAAFP